jgi:hypothetical protein
MHADRIAAGKLATAKAWVTDLAGQVRWRYLDLNTDFFLCPALTPESGVFLPVREKVVRDRVGRRSSSGA